MRPLGYIEYVHQHEGYFQAVRGPLLNLSHCPPGVPWSIQSQGIVLYGWTTTPLPTGYGLRLPGA